LEDQDFKARLPFTAFTEELEKLTPFQKLQNKKSKFHPKGSRRKEIIKINGEVDEMKNEHHIKEMQHLVFQRD
jgi:hypothetical protein